ncbi:efflux RND transporter periplasmic adaptor subunit [cf. Phormidesmis sp. LEGE 11477]|nr:efflux RND transporter periplasmic adaptor subunit [cf. Phormidesmis sp. LEGE 11477]
MHTRTQSTEKRSPKQQSTKRPFKTSAIQLGLLIPLLATAGCSLLPASEAQPGGGRGQSAREEGPVVVKTMLAETGSVAGLLTYTGTTRPVQQVALRAQVDGEVTSLLVDVGDAIAQGMLLAQLDGDLQTTTVNQAQAELSARRAETAQAAVSISEARAAVVQAEATLAQAQIDAERLRQLANQGAIALQSAEAAELAVTNARQTLRSAQARVAAQSQAAASAADRIDAQQAIVTQTQKQLSYADLRSPLTGVVLSKQVDIGSFVESGATLLELGDISSLEVTVQVSELDISQLSLGQSARVTLDAFPGEGSILGQITQIAPLADQVSRLVPVQVTIPNSGSSNSSKIGSGLLARVQFTSAQQNLVVVPASALTLERASEAPSDSGAVGEVSEDATLFVIEKQGEEQDEQTVAIARLVKIGNRDQDRVEIISGLDPREAFITQSDRPLTSGQAVRLSILSESNESSTDEPMVEPAKGEGRS